MLVSIVIPCYNSEHTIGQVVDLCMEEFDKMDGYECEMILVNDYSPDGTFETIKRMTEKYRMTTCRTIRLRSGSSWRKKKKAMMLCLGSLKKENFLRLKI